MSSIQDAIEDIPFVRPPVTPRITRIPPIFNPYVQPDFVANFETKSEIIKYFLALFHFKISLFSESTR